MSMIDNFKLNESSAEFILLRKLRQLRQFYRTDLKAVETPQKTVVKLTIGQKFADLVASTMGSWRFIIIQSVMLVIWVTLNLTAYIQKWDPYPFILLNLALSFQAAYAAPFIMMSQNRQLEIDRQEAKNDYLINIKAELEIELLHSKIDAMREEEIKLLIQTVAELTKKLEEKNSSRS